MLVDTFIQRAPSWVESGRSDADTVLLSQLTLSRALADVPFPERCTLDELSSVQERIHATLDALNLLSKGTYYPLDELTPLERQFLAERRLLDRGFLKEEGPRGVYVSDDQTMSIMVNGADHIALRTVVTGLDLNDAWNRLTALDDTLSATLDFAYDDTLGFLTSQLESVGTGLKVAILLHLPTLSMGDKIGRHAAALIEHGILLQGVCTGGGESAPLQVSDLGQGLGSDILLEHSNEQSLLCDMNGGIGGSVKDTHGDLFLLRNQRCLGVSEEEIIFQVRHGAEQLMADEKEARAIQQRDGLRGLEDRVGRAEGVAQGARLIGFSEGLALLSSLRLGVETGLLPKCSLAELNQLFLASQGAHLALAHGEACDAWTLTSDRADLFRARLN